MAPETHTPTPRWGLSTLNGRTPILVYDTERGGIICALDFECSDFGPAKDDEHKAVIVAAVNERAALLAERDEARRLAEAYRRTIMLSSIARELEAMGGSVVPIPWTPDTEGKP